MGGSLSYQAGLSAEAQVAADYRRRGYEILAQRWRGFGAEIDLICADPPSVPAAGVVFVEIKKSRSHARAADNLRPAQARRLMRAAEGFLATCPQGLLTPTRFDLAVVDAVGRIQIIENALLEG